jgi:hypothetical protein
MVLGFSSHKLDILNTEWINTAIKLMDNTLKTCPLITSHEMGNLRIIVDFVTSLM